ncbi:Sugar or nucleoside kinase, ribokinase family [Deinococcus hopiensis KR-140]|uniref:Sugar or nucleoside kinase, ribokinase family n=1 Tax=Deinococcus hopiensis KR-140 TaxID=695939 RepID=A0A1W1VK78_9DEIO|nr:Sugar or nucleoside kinase, ribokinase family [Deinococcus hopiensis KR-140]
MLVCGNVNLELGFTAPALPLPEVESVEHPGALTLGVSGVGFNVAHALARLGGGTRFLGFAGADAAGEVVRTRLAELGIGAHWLPAPATPLSLVLTGPCGGRQIHRDLKGLNGAPAPRDAFLAALPGCEAVVLSNVPWTKDLLSEAQTRGLPVVTDLQATPGPGEPYDEAYLHADVLFLSGARLPLPPLDALRAYRQRCDPEVLVIGLGEDGALLSERGRLPWHQPAVSTRPVVSTNGAGDALLAAFVCAYFGGMDAREALRLACIFASWACGEPGGAAGHLDWKGLTALAGSVPL